MKHFPDTKKRRIIFTGGGSAGHVTPNLAIMEEFRAAGWEIFYVGSRVGIERALVTKTSVPYYAVATGKLRRHASWRHFIEPFKILRGIVQAAGLCHKIKPDLVFSKGGFVAFPVVVGAWLTHIPVVVHESDLTPGLANRLSFPFARKVCLGFEETKKYFKDSRKLVVTGTPIRASLLRGDAARGRRFCGFDSARPVLLVMGGSLGAEAINHCVRALLPALLPLFYVVHLCGHGKLDAALQDTAGYRQWEYLDAPLPDVMAAAALCISRAGANAVNELITLKKPTLFIPLSRRASRGDQIDNAQYAVQRGLGHLLREEDLTPARLLQAMTALKSDRPSLLQTLEAYAKNPPQRDHTFLKQLASEGAKPLI